MRIHRHITSTLAVSLLFALCLGVAACGLTSGAADTSGTSPSSSNPNGASTNCGHVTPPTASTSPGGSPEVPTPVKTAIQQKTVTPRGPGTPIVGGGSVTPAVPNPLQPAPNAPITPGQITVTTDKAKYTACEKIQVVIANGLPSRIFVADHQSNCTIVTLQVQVKDQWQDVEPCRIETPSRMYTLASGVAVMQTLIPGFGNVTGAQGRDSGTYRIQLRYLTGPSPNKGTPPPSGQPINSSTFAVS